MDTADFRRHGHELVDWIADYVEHVERYPVLSRAKPGDIRAALPTHAPEDGESFDAIMADFERVLVPGLTHWNHPGFFAYFAITASPPGILAEFLAAAINQQAMLWRTSPASTELEAVSLDWLRQLIGLPGAFEGVIYDTASVSTMHSLLAAREAGVSDVRRRGLAGRRDVPALRVYCSEQCHSSIDKGVIAIGLGHESLRKIPVDDEYRMRPDALRDAIAEDRAAGRLPIAVVATVGTTSTTSVDPVGEVADVCERERLWLHVDAAYAGVAAMLPSHSHILNGAERADSLVVNPHKWLFAPVDISVLYCRRMDVLRAAFASRPSIFCARRKTQRSRI
jgi:aromatic-L-amino-acid decarboxylase